MARLVGRLQAWLLECRSVVSNVDLCIPIDVDTHMFIVLVSVVS